MKRVILGIASVLTLASLWAFAYVPMTCACQDGGAGWQNQICPASGGTRSVTDNLVCSLATTCVVSGSVTATRDSACDNCMEFFILEQWNQNKYSQGTSTAASNQFNGSTPDLVCPSGSQGTIAVVRFFTGGNFPCDPTNGTVNAAWNHVWYCN